ncbi:4-hydroxy-tetrahydrodipicolinate synthase [Bacteroidetes/Chlorobi group bacterium Naka2016]|jgi:4-hydroxy-tetrahydrodipicolinate synthase|nr:MAG: 4-hydroxy-tetrahydrodipicolinate synthase [Bacteroidetes/Chlorobi group bacterium Naka2016]
MKKFTPVGTFTALITPFNRKGEVDFKALRKLIDFQIENGVDGIVVCATTGESATLSLKEKQAIIVESVEHTNGRVPVIAGTGTNETELSLNMTIFAMEHGADACLLVAPYYNKPNQSGLYEHFRLIATNVDIPLILYNVPGRTGVNISAQTQIRLAQDCPNIVATKEASGNLDQIMKIIQNAPSTFSVLSGDDSLTLPIIALGGKGVISVISNYAPKQFSEMVRLALQNKIEKAREIHYNLLELMELNFIEPNPIPVKYAMSLLGFTKEVYRLPLLPLENEAKKKIKESLKKAKILE